jgi:glutamyl-tRNA synthetase
MVINHKQVRVRFAPSPTGFLHVGGARTAIFNWLFARKHRGQFFLRIEDTDVARSGDAMVQAIFNGLKWLGLNWDGDVVFQSQRFGVYQEFAEQLVLQRKAYKCFCSPESLQTARELAIKEKRTYKYDRRCLQLSVDEIRARENEKQPFVIRLRIPEGQTDFDDTVYGVVKFDNQQLDDFILLRRDGVPTYHMAVVVDDKDMQITHVIRGDDHLSNTPKHILLYEAFGWDCPAFAHVPLILGPDKQRLSKRHGATAIEEYEKAGYLPEAVFNFLTLLGWSPGADREIFSKEEIVEAFDLDGISKKSAVFDERKLEWMNGQYLNAMSVGDFLEIAQPMMNGKSDKATMLKIASLIKPRVRRLNEIAGATSYFFGDPTSYDEKAVAKHWHDETAAIFDHIISRVDVIDDFVAANIEQAFRSLADQLGVSAAHIIHPTRLALTGQSNSPGIFEVIEILGKEAVTRRLQKAIHFLRTRSSEIQAVATEV